MSPSISQAPTRGQNPTYAMPGAGPRRTSDDDPQAWFGAPSAGDGVVGATEATAGADDAHEFGAGAGGWPAEASVGSVDDVDPFTRLPPLFDDDQLMARSDRTIGPVAARAFRSLHSAMRAVTPA